MLITKYGKLMIEDKYKQLLGTTVKASGSNLRITVFGRLLRLISPPFEMSDLRTYLDINEFLTTLNIGVKVDNREDEESQI